MDIANDLKGPETLSIDMSSPEIHRDARSLNAEDGVSFHCFRRRHGEFYERRFRQTGIRGPLIQLSISHGLGGIDDIHAKDLKIKSECKHRKLKVCKGESKSSAATQMNNKSGVNTTAIVHPPNLFIQQTKPIERIHYTLSHRVATEFGCQRRRVTGGNILEW